MGFWSRKKTVTHPEFNRRSGRYVIVPQQGKICEVRTVWTETVWLKFAECWKPCSPVTWNEHRAKIDHPSIYLYVPMSNIEAIRMFPLDYDEDEPDYLQVRELPAAPKVEVG